MSSTLTGSGQLSGAFITGLDSKVQLTGNMTLGTSNASLGVEFGGSLEIGPHTLTLLDSDGAEFYGDVTLGLNGTSSTAPGRLQAARGITLMTGQTITGAGTIEVGSASASAFTNNGALSGTSAASPLVLSGYVTGNGTMANVEVRGTLDPGVPTTIANYGSVVYQGTLALDLRGNTPGTGYDQINHSTNATLGGTLSVTLGNNYVPVPGSQWTLIKTSGSFTGQFSHVQLPAPVSGRNWQVVTTSNSIVLQLVDLALTITPSTIAENGGSVTGRVTRTTLDASQPLIVNLTSSDTTEATVPATVTIPAGATSANFTIQIVDDSILDDFQSVNITASSAGFGSVSQTLIVTDVETLSLAVSADSVLETTGSITGTVTRNNTDLGSARTINLQSSDLTELSVPASVIIPAGQSSVTFTIAIVDDNLLDGTQTATITAHSPGYTSASKSVDVLDLELLSLTLLSTSISENGGTAQARLTRTNSNIGLPLTVNLQSSDTSEATVPAQVTIAAGASFVLFQVTAVDDTLLDGLQNAIITASATGYRNETQTLSVTDFESLSLSLSSTSISESGGSSVATITRSNTDISQPLTVTLTGSDTSEATIPATVTIPANQSSATFTINAVDDDLLDGTQTVTLTATAADYQSATSVVTVVDSEQVLLSIDRTSISEKSGSAIGTVRRSNSDVNLPLAVQINSSDLSEATVPGIVVIPPGPMRLHSRSPLWTMRSWMALKA